MVFVGPLGCAWMSPVVRYRTRMRPSLMTFAITSPVKGGMVKMEMLGTVEIDATVLTNTEISILMAPK